MISSISQKRKQDSEQNQLTKGKQPEGAGGVGGEDGAMKEPGM